MKTGLLVAAIVMVTACQQRAAPSVDKAWVRLSAVPGNPAAAYFTLKGGAKDETLTMVAAPGVARAEMHESMKSGGGMTSMAPIKLVAVRAGDTVTFAPGGKHVMLFGVKPQVQPGTTTLLSFSLGSGQKLMVQARVVGAGDPAPTD